jgi:uncharacterized membrane-anchored protein YitT (DUF2179 family)
MPKKTSLEVFCFLIIDPLVEDLREHPLDWSLWLTAAIYFAVPFFAGAPIWQCLLFAIIVFVLMSWGFVRKVFTYISALILLGSMLVFTQVISTPPWWQRIDYEEGSSSISAYIICSFFVGFGCGATALFSLRRRRSIPGAQPPVEGGGGIYS